jgi:S1-C subfamily serine protease
MTNLELLRRRVERTFGDKPPVAALERVRAIVGTNNLPATFEGNLAKEALAKLKDPAADTPSPRELAALEMMLRMMRPAPKYEDGQLEDLSEPEFLEAFKNWNRFRTLLEPLKASIGRIDVGPGDTAGTGFLVGDEVLVTNRHVLDVLSRGTRMLQPGQGTVTFFAELHPTTSEPPVAIESVIAFHPTLDIALLRVKPRKRRTLTIATAAPALEEQVAAVGHPFDDPVNNPLFTRTIFGNSWGVKRVAPGEVVSQSHSMIGHDCSTLGGNSGSPLLSLNSAEVVGLHFGGGFLWRNEAVSCIDLNAFVAANG